MRDVPVACEQIVDDPYLINDTLLSSLSLSLFLCILPPGGASSGRGPNASSSGPHGASYHNNISSDGLTYVS